MHLFQGHRTSSEPLWHVGLPPLFTQAYIHSLHRFLAHFMICDDYFMISSGFPFHSEDDFSRFLRNVHAGCSGIMYYMYEMDSRKGGSR